MKKCLLSAMICLLYCAGYSFGGFANKAEIRNQIETFGKEFAERLSESMKIIDVNSKGGYDPLISAALRSDAATIEKLLKAGANPNVQDVIGETALMHASYYGDIKIVEMLLKAKADPNIQDDGGDTALMQAARKNHVEIVRMLIKAKANPNIQDRYGYTALIYAYNNKEIVVMLLEAGANPNIKNNLGETAVSRASKYGYKEVAKILKNASKK